MRHIKLIALDIDGVLNTSRRKSSHAHYNMHDDKIELLNKIISATTTDKVATHILLSSTWRLDFKDEASINMWFEAAGVIPVCCGKTDYTNAARGMEILTWIFKHQYINNTIVENLVILDDDNDMELLMPWLVLTENMIGLTESNVNEAIHMLQKPFRLDIQLYGGKK